MPDEEYYWGDLKDGVKEGIGLLWSSTELYVGQFKAELKHGEGMLVHDGRSYLGSYQADKKHGNIYTVTEFSVEKDTFIEGNPTDDLHDLCLKESDKILQRLVMFNAKIQEGKRKKTEILKRFDDLKEKFDFKGVSFQKTVYMSGSFSKEISV